MSDEMKAFRDFEQAGWAASSVCQTYHEVFASLTTQSIEHLLNAANVSAHSTVLDVACGAGYAAGLATVRGAQATGVDFSPSMIEMAKGNYPTIHFQESDADQLPFANESFDAVINNFGKPHLPDPQAAAHEAFRVLKSGGYYAFSAWDAPQRTISFGAIYGAIQALGTMNVNLPPGPNFFLFSNPEQCKQCLSQAGFVEPNVEILPLVLRVSNPDLVFEGVFGGTVRVAAVLKAQEPQALEKIKSAVRSKISEYALGDHFAVPMPAVLAYARKP